MEERNSMLRLWLIGTKALDVRLEGRNLTVSGAWALRGCGVEMQGFDRVIAEGTKSGLEDSVLIIESDMEHQ